MTELTAIDPLPADRTLYRVAGILGPGVVGRSPIIQGGIGKLGPVSIYWPYCQVYVLKLQWEFLYGQNSVRPYIETPSGPNFESYLFDCE